MVLNTIVNRNETQSRQTNGRTTFFSNAPCILCVDDDPLGLTVRGHILRDRGYSVVLLDHPELVNSHSLDSYQLAIVDFDMPGLNGLELLFNLRAAGAGFPILLLSGSVAFLPSAKKERFTACIDKGSPPNHFLNVVEKYLSGHNSGAFASGHCLSSVSDTAEGGRP